ncbi:MAG: YhfC family glutamic-type intramembrane protease [Anaerolineales bacterium]
MTTTALILRIINALLMVGIPCSLVLILVRCGEDGFKPIGIGIVAFLISQAAHIPFNYFLLTPALKSGGIWTSVPGWRLLALGVALGLSAGVFEEITRYVAFRFWLTKNPNQLLPVKFGIGHGGIEAFLLGILAFYALIQVLVLGGEGALVSFSPDQTALIQSQIDTYWNIPWHHSLLGAWERVAAMVFHLGASLMVYKSIRQKKIIWLMIAIGGHALLDAFAVVALQVLDFVLLESILLAFALGWLYWAWRVRELPNERVPIINIPRETIPTAGEFTSEQLEESRYDE